MHGDVIVCDFNSIKVRLELCAVPGASMLSGDFNSIKVRLERNYRDSTKLLFAFQFHKGTIRTATLQPVTAGYADFNSIKVRLEQEPGQLQHTALPQFQFHKGTIRTLTLNFADY